MNDGLGPVPPGQLSLELLAWCAFALGLYVAAGFWWNRRTQAPTPRREPRSLEIIAKQSEVPLPAAVPVPLHHWWIQVQDAPLTLPHLIVLSPLGSGKSTLLEALAKDREGLLYIIQPNRRYGEWVGLPVVECDDDGGFAPIEIALTQLQAEFKRRGGAMKTGSPGPWLTVVWDEVPLCIEELGGDAKKDNPARKMVRKLLMSGRPRKMRVILGSPSERVGALGIEGYGDMLQSCGIVRLKQFATATCPAALGDLWPTSLELNGYAPAWVERGPVSNLAQQPLRGTIWTPQLPLQ